MVAKPLIIIVITACLLSFKGDLTLAQELIFKDHGKMVKTLSLKQLDKITPALMVTVLDPHTSENRRYKSFTENALLTGIYGDRWKDTDEILFTCSDGYKASIPSKQFKEYSSYLVYSSPNTKEFRVLIS